MKQSLIKIVSTKFGKYLFIPWLIVFGSCYSFAQTNVSKEYQIKAAFIYNFVNFIEWPENSFSTEQSPIIIGVIGENPFGTYLEETVKGEKVKGHPIIVQYFKNVDEELNDCHVLFISPSETDKIDYILTKIKGRNILSITNNLEDSTQKEVIRFLIKNNKTQFQINPEAANEANLILSSKLLNVSIIYYPKN